jgi:hypothetical protein
MQSLFGIQARASRRPPLPPPSPSARSNPVCYDRTEFTYDSITLYGWPSGGGIVVLEATDPPPPSLYRRHTDQVSENHSGQKLLRLGAKAFNGLECYEFVDVD